MHIKIAQRLRPFSHEPGSRVLVPGTTCCLEVYPTLARVYSLEKSEAQLLQEVPLSVRGPVRQFTVTQDLEKGRVAVWGYGQDGFYRFYAFKGATGDVVFAQDKGQADLLPVPQEVLVRDWAPQERLSLGSHRKQEWPQLSRHMDLATILPIWLRLGQTLPDGPWRASSGTGLLVDHLETAVTSGLSERVVPRLEQLILAGFEGVLAPRLNDCDHHGIELTPVESSESPLALLAEGAAQIRRLFFQEQPEGLAFLPLLPPQFHAGRYMGLSTKDGSLLHFEWSKKQLRRVELIPCSQRVWSFHTKGGLKSCRLRTRGNSKGRRCPLHEPLHLEPGVQYFFDNFRK